MAKRRSSIGLFGMFGRSGDLRQLDQALRAADLHPALVPEGVKLTIVNLMKDHEPGDEPPPQAYPYAASIVGYCVLGRDAFARVHGAAAADAVEARIEAALVSGGGFDAEMILLTHHAKIINPAVVERFDISADER